MHRQKQLVMALLAAGGLLAGGVRLLAQSAQDWPWEANTADPRAGARASAVAPAAGAQTEPIDLTAPPVENAPPADDMVDPEGFEGIEGTESDISMIDDELSGAADDGAPAGDERGFVEDAPAMGAGGKAATAKGRIDVSAYEDLLRENMQLRREVTDLQQGIQDSLSDKQRLEGEMRDLERQVSESVTLIQALRQGGATGQEAPDAAAPASVELDQLRAEKDQLQAELEALKAQMQSQPAAAGGGASPTAGSDLYRALEEENAGLKSRATELESARQAATTELEALKSTQAAGMSEVDSARGREAELTAKLNEALATSDKRQKTIDKLLERVPSMETELAGLRDTVGMKDRNLQARDRDLESLKLEMERREQRLIKAERMSELMEKTREEVQQVSKKEQRDLHYNMASVYAKESRYAEAEREYLQALRVDPTDAGSHYNLAILYEDVLNDKRKAAMHYRAYLKLSPNADDADEVKSWLLQLDMN